MEGKEPLIKDNPCQSCNTVITIIRKNNPDCLCLRKPVSAHVIKSFGFSLCIFCVRISADLKMVQMCQIKIPVSKMILPKALLHFILFMNLFCRGSAHQQFYCKLAREANIHLLSPARWFTLVYLLCRSIPVGSQGAPPPRMVNLCQATQTTLIAPNPMLQGALLMQQMQGMVRTILNTHTGLWCFLCLFCSTLCFNPGNMRGFRMGGQQFCQFFTAGSRSSLLGPVPMGMAIKSPMMGYPAGRQFHPHARYYNNTAAASSITSAVITTATTTLHWLQSLCGLLSVKLLTYTIFAQWTNAAGLID